MHPRSSRRQDSVPASKRPNTEKVVVEDSETSLKKSPRAGRTTSSKGRIGSDHEVEGPTRIKRARLGKSPRSSAKTLQTRDQDLSHAMLSNFPSSPNHSNFVDLTSSPTSGRKSALSAYPRSNGANTAPQHNETSKRLVVKNLRQSSNVDLDSYFQTLWGQLDGALEVIFAGKGIDSLNEESYRRAENICRHGGASKASDKLRRRCGTYVRGPMKTSLLEQSHNSNIDVLRNTVEAWATWQTQVVSLNPL